MIKLKPFKVPWTDSFLPAFQTWCRGVHDPLRRPYPVIWGQYPPPAQSHTPVCSWWCHPHGSAEQKQKQGDNMSIFLSSMETIELWYCVPGLLDNNHCHHKVNFSPASSLRGWCRFNCFCWSHQHKSTIEEQSRACSLSSGTITVLLSLPGQIYGAENDGTKGRICGDDEQKIKKTHKSLLDWLTQMIVREYYCSYC